MWILNPYIWSAGQIDVFWLLGKKKERNCWCKCCHFLVKKRNLLCPKLRHSDQHNSVINEISNHWANTRFLVKLDIGLSLKSAEPNFVFSSFFFLLDFTNFLIIMLWPCMFSTTHMWLIANQISGDDSWVKKWNTSFRRKGITNNWLLHTTQRWDHCFLFCSFVFQLWFILLYFFFCVKNTLMVTFYIVLLIPINEVDEWN